MKHPTVLCHLRYHCHFCHQYHQTMLRNTNTVNHEIQFVLCYHKSMPSGMHYANCLSCKFFIVKLLHHATFSSCKFSFMHHFEFWVLITKSSMSPLCSSFHLPTLPYNNWNNLPTGFVHIPVPRSKPNVQNAKNHKWNLSIAK